MRNKTEAKKSYKKTKLGWIPEEWETKKLGDLGSFSKGKGISKKELTKTGLPCIRYGEIYTSHDFFIKNFYSFIDNKTAKQSKAIKKNDILFAGSGETLEDIGKSVAYLGEDEAYVGGDIIILSAKGVDVLFLVYLLNSNCIIKQRISLGQGHSVVHIYANYLKELLIPYPSFPEQQKIAQILATWDSAIEKTEQLIAAKEKLKKGLMQQLLSGKNRFKGFIKNQGYLKTKIGWIPEDWNLVNIDEISDVKGGKRLPKGHALTETKTPYPYIRVADMFMGGVSMNDIKYVPVHIYPTIKNYRIFKEDLFITVAGTLGIVGSITEKLNGANLTENANKLTNIKCNRKFLLNVLMSPFIQRYIEAEKTTNAQPKLALTRIRKFKVPLPTFPEQQKIASVLSAADKEIEMFRNQLEKLKEQKKGLMQVLLTGKVRVKIENQ